MVRVDEVADPGGLAHPSRPLSPSPGQTAGMGIQGHSGVDTWYFVEVEIGTPPITYSLQADTGSSDLWVVGEACGDCSHIPLGPKSSSTFVGTQAPWNITYGIGSAHGKRCIDTVKIAGLNLDNHIFGQSHVHPPSLTRTEDASGLIQGGSGTPQASLRRSAMTTPST